MVALDPHSSFPTKSKRSLLQQKVLLKVSENKLQVEPQDKLVLHGPANASPFISPPTPTVPPPGHSISAILVPKPLSEPSTPTPASRPLYLQFPLPRMPWPLLTSHASPQMAPPPKSLPCLPCQRDHTPTPLVLHCPPHWFTIISILFYGLSPLPESNTQRTGTTSNLLRARSQHPQQSLTPGGAQGMFVE